MFNALCIKHPCVLAHTNACHLTKHHHHTCLPSYKMDSWQVFTVCVQQPQCSFSLVLSPDNSFLHYVVCTEHHNSICIPKRNNKILTLLVFSEPKLRDQPPKSLYYLPTVDTTQPLCSQPTLLQNRISPRYSCRANTRGLPRGKSTGSTYDTTAQPFCVLTHKAYNLAITIDSAYFLLHPVCSS